MLSIIQTVLGFILGKGADTGKANVTAGLVNYAWALPALGWVWYHRAETIVIQIVLSNKGVPDVLNILTTTYLGLSLVIGGIFLYVEFNRRST